MIVVVGTFRLPLENRAAALEAMARVTTITRAEPGCLAYAYAEDVLEPGLYRVSEAWTDRAALAAHFAAPHMDEWRRVRDAFGLSDRQMTAYAVMGEEPL